VRADENEMTGMTCSGSHGCSGRQCWKRKEKQKQKKKKKQERGGFIVSFPISIRIRHLSGLAGRGSRLKGRAGAQMEQKHKQKQSQSA
jgi:hypothetical protein